MNKLKVIAGSLYWTHNTSRPSPATVSRVYIVVSGCDDINGNSAHSMVLTLNADANMLTLYTSPMNWQCTWNP